jgi:hypothetical protein
MLEVKHRLTRFVKPQLVFFLAPSHEHKGMTDDEKTEEAIEVRLARAARLREVLNSKRGLSSKAGEICEVSRQSVNGWKTTGRIETGNALKLCQWEEISVNFEWLWFGVGPKFRTQLTDKQRQWLDVLARIEDRPNLIDYVFREAGIVLRKDDRRAIHDARKKPSTERRVSNRRNALIIKRINPDVRGNTDSESKDNEADQS